MNIDNTLAQRYAPILASAVVLLPAVDILAKSPTPLAILQFIALVAASAGTWRLRGGWKLGVEWIGVLVAAVLPLAIAGDATWSNWALVAVAIVKALATHLGVAIRQDPTIDARDTPAGVVPIVTTLTDETLEPDDALVPRDGLAASPSSLTPGPDHRADS